MDEIEEKPQREPIDFAALADDDLVDESAACEYFGGPHSPIHRSTLRRGIKAKRFAAGIKISDGIVRWTMGSLRQSRSALIGS